MFLMIKFKNKPTFYKSRKLLFSQILQYKNKNQKLEKNIVHKSFYVDAIFIHSRLSNHLKMLIFWKYKQKAGINLF